MYGDSTIHSSRAVRHKVDGTSHRCPLGPPAASELRRWSRVARRQKRTTEQSRALTGANVNRISRRETITETQTAALDIETVKPEKIWTLNNGTYRTKQGDTDDPSTRNGTRRAYRHYGHLWPGGRYCPKHQRRDVWGVVSQERRRPWKRKPWFSFGPSAAAMHSSRVVENKIQVNILMLASRNGIATLHRCSCSATAITE